MIAYVGDGGFAMLMAEFLTAARAKLPIKVVINNNNSLGQILWEQMVLGYPEHGVRFPAPTADYAAWATACGGYGAKVSDPKKVRPALERALAFDGPALVDIDVDPNEPPLPGKVAYDQAKKFAQAWPSSTTARKTGRASRRRAGGRSAKPSKLTSTSASVRMTSPARAWSPRCSRRNLSAGCGWRTISRTSSSITSASGACRRPRRRARWNHWPWPRRGM